MTLPSAFPACRQALNLAWYRAGRRIPHSAFGMPLERFFSAFIHFVPLES